MVIALGIDSENAIRYKFFKSEDTFLDACRHIKDIENEPNKDAEFVEGMWLLEAVCVEVPKSV